MRKKLFGRILSLVLSATMVLTPSVTAYAEGDDAVVLVQAEETEEDEAYVEAEEPAEELLVEAEETEDQVPIVEEDTEDDEDPILVGTDTVSVTFDLNYEGAPEPKQITGIAAGTKVLQVEGIPDKTKRTGYAFAAWYATKDEETGRLSDLVDENTEVTDGAVYYATWESEQYDIVYVFNGTGAGWASDEDEEAAPTVALFGTTIGINGKIPSPVRENYSFVEWNTESDGSGTTVTGTTVLDENTFDDLVGEDNKITLHAFWGNSPTPYNITFDANGGSFVPMPGQNPQTIRKVELPAGSKYPTAPNNTAVGKVGYTLVGWATNSAATVPDYPDPDDRRLDADVTYYAIWQVEQYTLDFQLGYGHFDDGATVPTTVQFGAPIGEIPVPENEGYKFAGWNTVAEPTSENPGVVVTKDTVVNESNYGSLVKSGKITVYAQWEDALTVYFETDGGSIVKTQYVLSGEKATRPAVNPTKTGYTFDDWYVSQADGAAKFNFNNPITTDTTIYAKWKANSYPVVFSFENGGAFKKNAKKPSKVTVGQTFGDIDDPEKAGYTFVEWNTAKDRSGRKITKDTLFTDRAVASLVEDGKVTVYAIWNVNSYKVTYDYGYKDGDTEVTQEKDVTFDAAYPAPDADKLIRTGWYFDGWYNAKNKKVDVATAKYAATENTTLTGKWVEVTYNVTYNSNINKNASKKIAYKYSTATDEEIKPADVFTKFEVKNTFLGWATEKLVYNTTGNKLSTKALIEDIQADGPATAKVYNIAVYAQWAASSTYKIAINPNLPEGSLDSDLGGIYSDSGHVESVNYAEPFILNGTELGLYGYTLSGWEYTNAKGKVVSIKPKATLVSLTDVPDATVTLNAKWKAKTYTLKYDLNGGTVANKKTTPLTVKYTVDEKTRAGVPLYNYEKDPDNANQYNPKADPEVTRKGYEFGGWSEGRRYYGKNIYEDITVKAYWNAIHYTVKVDPNGGSVVYNGNNKTDIFKWTEDATYLAACNLSLLTPSRDGYKFKGWTVTGANGKTKTYKANTYLNVKDLLPDTEGGKTYTVKADWDPLSYKVKYNLDGGKIKGQPTTYKTGVATKAIPVPTMTGHTFSEWSVTVNGVDADIDTVLSDDYKILPTVWGDLEFTADYGENYYTIEVWDKEGKTEYEEARMTGLSYYRTIDFYYTADKIEELERFDKTLSVKGFASKPNGSPTYQLHKIYSGLAGKKATGDKIKIYTITQPRVYRIGYVLNGGSIKSPVYEYRTPSKDQTLKTTATRKGFKFLGWTASDGAPVVKNDDGYVTAIAKDATGDFTLTAVYGDENKYTITIAPNAKDVYSEDAVTHEKKRVDAKGILYDNGRQIDYSDYTSVKALANYLYTKGWARKGYYIGGFATDKAGKKMVWSLGGLSDGKKAAVTVYAIWKPIDTINVEFSSDAEILRDGRHYTTLYEHQLGISFAEETTQVFGKAVNTKKLSATGYIFKGWKVNEDYSEDGYSVVYTDKTNTYVKSVAKDNVADVSLYPVFEEIHYKLYLDPNGGVVKTPFGLSYNKKSFLREAYYTEDLTMTYGIVLPFAGKAGYYPDYISTSKNTKGILAYNYVNSSGRINTQMVRTSELATKNNASVTLNLMWRKVETAKINVRNAGISGDELRVFYSTTNHKKYENASYEIQYSPNSRFLYNVATVVGGEGGFVLADDIREGQEYYVRARECKVDSAGNNVYGPWSATVRATKSAIATVEVTFDAGEGAKIGEAQTYKKSYEIGRALGELPVVTTLPENKKFEGWYDAATGGTEVTAGTVANATLTKVYAHYKNAAPATVTVTFNLNYDGAAQPTVIENVAADAKVLNLDAARSATREGYRLEGWYETKDPDTGALSDKVNAATVVTDEKVYYAKWVKIWTITFNANGGEWDDGSTTLTMTVDDGGTYPILPNTTPKLAGKTFDGWAPTADATERNYPHDQTVSSDREFFVVWQDRLPGGISVKTRPNKTTYSEGEYFDPTGLVITMSYDNGETEDIEYSEGAGITFEPGLTTQLDSNVNSIIIYLNGFWETDVNIIVN